MANEAIIAAVMSLVWVKERRWRKWVGERCSGMDCCAGNGDRQTSRRGFHGLGGEHGYKSTRAHVQTAFGEEFAQPFDSAADPFSGSVLAGAEHLADFVKRFALEIAQQDGSPVGVVERVHGLIEKGFNLRPVNIGGIHGVEFVGDLFADLAAGFAANNIDGGAAGDLIQPRGKDRVRREAIRLTAEVDEDGLGDFLRQLPGTDQSERGGKDEIEVATDDFCEGILRVLPGVSRKQLQIGIAHFISISLPIRKPDGESSIFVRCRCGVCAF